MDTLNDILMQGTNAKGRSRLNPNGNANAPERGAERSLGATEPKLNMEVKGRSRLNPHGDVNAPERGGEKSLGATTMMLKTNVQNEKEQGVSVPKPNNLEELRKAIDPYTPPTPEELEKEKKKEKRKKIFSAIGDGIAALSNLYFASQGAPSMYDGKNTMTEAVKVSYDKLRSERDKKNAEYFNRLKGIQGLEAAERQWQRQLGLDEEARDRYNESITHRNEREKLADERYEKEQAKQKARTEEENRRWQENFDENKRRADRSYNFQVKQHDDNIAVRREQAAATRAKGVRGKQLGFADGNGNQVNIYENVWKGSMQQVYDAMLSDLAPADEAERKRWERQMKKLDTPQKKEDYVKQNWHKSPKASQIMLTLSGIDPATMTSELNDDVEDYIPGGGDDEVIDYTPGKK